MGDHQGEIKAENLEELTEAIEHIRERMRYLKNDIAFYPPGYDEDGVLADQLKRRGETTRDWRSTRIGFSIGYSAGFLQAAKYACEAFEILDNE